MQNDITEKGYATFASITVAEDDTPGIDIDQDAVYPWNILIIPEGL